MEKSTNLEKDKEGALLNFQEAVDHTDPSTNSWGKDMPSVPEDEDILADIPLESPSHLSEKASGSVEELSEQVQNSSGELTNNSHHSNSIVQETVTKINK